MSTNYIKTFHLNGIAVQGVIDVMDGEIHNVNRLLIGNWSFELDVENNDLIIRNGGAVKLRLNNMGNDESNYKYEKFFMIEQIKIEDSFGMMVSASSSKKIYNMDMSQTPNNNNALPTIELSKREKDPAFIGIIVGCENCNRSVTIGHLSNEYQQEDNVNRVYVNSSGTGTIWVTDIGGPILKGDYITSSIIPGYGMRQKDSIRHNYSGPRAIISCDFNPKEIVLETPIDINDDGPIYQPLTNLNGEYITDFEYEIKFVKFDGSRASKREYREQDFKKQQIYCAALIAYSF